MNHWPQRSEDPDGYLRARNADTAKLLRSMARHLITVADMIEHENYIFDRDLDVARHLSQAAKNVTTVGEVFVTEAASHILTKHRDALIDDIAARVAETTIDEIEEHLRGGTAA